MERKIAHYMVLGIVIFLILVACKQNFLRRQRMKDGVKILDLEVL